MTYGADHHPSQRLAFHAVIVTWNNYLDTKECIESLLAGSQRPDQVVLVDNGSQSTYVESLQALTREHPSVTLIRNPENYGYARAANIGICRALKDGAEGVFLINNDAVVARRALEELAAAGEECSQFEMFGPRILYYDDPKRIWEGGGRYVFLKQGVVGHERNRLVKRCADALREVTYLTGCAVLIRSSVFEKVGLYDEDFYLFAEDPDFCLRAREAGVRLLYVPKAVVLHNVPVARLHQTTPIALYHAGRSHVLLARKHYKKAFLAIAVSSYVLLHGTYTLIQLARGAGRVRDFTCWLAGAWDGLRRRPPRQTSTSDCKGSRTYDGTSAGT